MSEVKTVGDRNNLPVPNNESKTIEGVLCDPSTQLSASADKHSQSTGTERSRSNWLKQAVGKGLSALVVLHLDGGPASETVTQTAAIWYRVLKGWPIVWDEALDRPRLTTAFLTLAGRSTRWPSPVQLREHLPPRVYPLKELPKPEYPKEQAKANLVRIKAMIRGALK